MKSCPALARRLAELAPAEVVSGGAAGVDGLAAAWARANGVALRELRPDYATTSSRGAPAFCTFSIAQSYAFFA